MENSRKHTAGSVRVSEDVIVKIAKTAACEISGVKFAQNSKQKSKLSAVKNNPVYTRLSGDTAALKLNIFVEEGFNAAAVAEDVQKSVKSAVQNMTGFTVTKVDVNIAGVVFSAESDNNGEIKPAEE